MLALKITLGHTRQKSLTDPIADNSVSSRTFSIADLEGLSGGGRTSVARSAIALTRCAKS